MKYSDASARAMLTTKSAFLAPVPPPPLLEFALACWIDATHRKRCDQIPKIRATNRNWATSGPPGMNSERMHLSSFRHSRPMKVVRSGQELAQVVCVRTAAFAMNRATPGPCGGLAPLMQMRWQTYSDQHLQEQRKLRTKKRSLKK